MSKELWIDRDECMMWFDMKPTLEAMGQADQASEWVAKIEVSDHVYQEYLSHCEDVRAWQEKLARWYRMEMNERKGEM